MACSRQIARTAFFACTALLAAALLIPATAGAAEPPPPFWKACQSSSSEPPVFEAGQCSIPRGIGVDPNTPGHLFVADQENKRIVELSAWGEFVKAWGWGVLDGSAEFQICTTETNCQTGIKGPGVGQFEYCCGPQGIAVDSTGAVYVVDWGNVRVQKFDQEGEFQLMFGAEVNQTKVEAAAPEAEQNLCTAVSGDVCKAGVSGTGPGEFSGWPIGSFIAPRPGGGVYVGDSERIQEFDEEGQYLGDLPDPEGLLVGETVHSLASDPTGSLFLIRSGDEEALKLNASGEQQCAAPIERPTAIAATPSGGFYLFQETSGFNIPGEVFGFGPGCEAIDLDPEGPGLGFGSEAEILRSTGLATGAGCLSEGHDLYLASSNQKDSFISAFGPPPTDAACPPERRAPTIEATYATSVGSSEAQLEALINPHYWSATQGTTTYYLQYATTACVEVEPEILDWEAACVKEQPAPPGATLKAGVVDEGVVAPVTLSGLEAGTAYRYRYLAEAKDSGGTPTVAGQPVIGPATSFATYPEPEGPLGDCPNEALRTGPSLALPDCRAYELVSPVDKEGGDVVPPAADRLDQSATSGGSLTYTSTSEADPFAQLLATRGEAGWSSEAIDPPSEGEAINPELSSRVPFAAFSADLSEAWLLTNHEPTLAAGAIAAYPNLYRRDNAEASYEACTTAEPPATPGSEYAPEAQGVSAPAGVAVFAAAGKLTEDAAEGQAEQLYACKEGALSLASALPSGFASPLQNSAGIANDPTARRRGSTLATALSADASRLYWTATEAGQGPGALYLRENPTAAQSAQEHGSALGTGDLIGPAEASCKTNKFLTTITACVPGVDDFAAGQQIEGPCIAAGTKVTGVFPEEGKLTVDLKPSATCSETPIAGLASSVVSSAVATQGAFAAGQGIVGTGIAPETTIEAVNGEAGTLTLSAPATQTGAEVPLEAFSACTEPAKACTLAVSGASGRFWAASADGSKALFSEGSALYRFDASTGTATLLAAGFAGLLGNSADLSRAYFLSGEDLAGGATEGQPNLYLHDFEAESTSFLATLSEQDAATGSGVPSPANPRPALHTARVTADGQVLAFASGSASLAQSVAGYDNTDQASGEPAAEVYLYDAGAAELICVSCNRSGARPQAAEVAEGLWAAALIPTANSSLYPGRPLSADGKRLFFESYDPLALADTNGEPDVYQWERSESGRCADEKAAFSPSNGGCIALISSGGATEGAEFIDADPDGENAFFATAAGLVAADPGQADIYDARVEGGFAPAEPHELTATKTGSGNGWLHSTPAGINCGNPCASKTASFEGEVTLTASGAQFAGWEACPGVEAGRECTITMDADTEAIAEYVANHALTVTKTGTGDGWVHSEAPTYTINCGAACTTKTGFFTQPEVTLTASGSQFVEWSLCPGVVGGPQGRNCTIALSEDKVAQARFE